MPTVCYYSILFYLFFLDDNTNSKAGDASPKAARKSVESVMTLWEKRKGNQKMFSSTVKKEILLHIKRSGGTHFMTNSYEIALPPAVICLRTLSGMVQLVCEWVISCP